MNCLSQNNHVKVSCLFKTKGADAEQVKEVLLAKLASLKDINKVTEFFKQFEAWKASNLK